MSRHPNPTGRLTGRVVIVTGGTRGIGLETCRRFLALGAKVGVVARGQHDVAAACRELHGTTAGAVADVADAAQLRAALTTIVADLGEPCSVLVNNAGHGDWGPALETDLEVFRRSLEVNFLGAVAATAVVLPDMVRLGRGHVVNVGSIAGRIGVPYEAAYSASKFALTGYSEALAAELAGTGVSVSLVQPGPVRTSFAAGRPARLARRGPRDLDPGVVAEAVVAAVVRGRSEQYLPRWLRAAHAVKVVAPPLHRIGIRATTRGLG
jgi:short-subunit dehydrogenase